MSQDHSTTSSEDRRRYPYLSTVLDPSTHKIIGTASARIYHSSFGVPQRDWTYSNIKGLLVFGRDRDVYGGDKANIAQGYRLSETYWFRLVDMATDRVVWMLRVPEVFEYQKDKPFFHVFPGSSRMFGFCFDDDEEAATFFSKVTSRTSRPKPTRRKSRSAKPPKHVKPTAFRAGRLNPSMISAPAPASFVHVAHIGINADGNIETSEDMDPAWAMMVQDLQGYGISHDILVENLDFVEGFLTGAKLAKSQVESKTMDSVKMDLTLDKPPEKKGLFRRRTVQTSI